MGEDGEWSKDVGSLLQNLAPSCKEPELRIWEVGEWVGSTKRQGGKEGRACTLMENLASLLAWIFLSPCSLLTPRFCLPFVPAWNSLPSNLRSCESFYSPKTSPVRVKEMKQRAKIRERKWNKELRLADKGGSLTSLWWSWNSPEVDQENRKKQGRSLQSPQIPGRK